MLCNGCHYLSWYVAIVCVMYVGLHLDESRCALYLSHIQIVMYFCCIIVLLVVTCCTILILSGMSLLVRPNRVELLLTVPQGVVITRVVVHQGVHLREMVTGLSRVLVRMYVYVDIVLIRKLCYQTLMVLHFSV